jgi:serine/threonine protein kinase
MTEEEKQETLREAKILEVLNHPNIIRFKEVYKTKKGQLCIVMDYADGRWCHFITQVIPFRRRPVTHDQEVEG